MIFNQTKRFGSDIKVTKIEQRNKYDGYGVLFNDGKNEGSVVYELKDNVVVFRYFTDYIDELEKEEIKREKIRPKQQIVMTEEHFLFSSVVENIINFHKDVEIKHFEIVGEVAIEEDEDGEKIAINKTFSKEEMKKMNQESYIRVHCFEKYEPIRKEIDFYVEQDLKKLEDTTKSLYGLSLEKFFEWFFVENFNSFPVPNEDGIVEKEALQQAINEEKINDFIHFLQSKKYGNAYVHRLLVVLLSYAEYKEIFVNKRKIEMPKVLDYQNIVVVKLGDRELQVIDNELKSRVEAAGKQSALSTFKKSASKVRDALRNRVLFNLILSSGSRLSSILELDMEHINWEKKRKKPYSIFLTKENREVEIDKQTMELLKEYKNFRESNDFEILHLKLYHHLFHHRLKYNNGDTEDVAIYRQFLKDNVHNQYFKWYLSLQDRIRQLKKEEKELGTDIRNALNEIGKDINKINYEAASNYARKLFEANKEDYKALLISNRDKRMSDSTATKFFQSLRDKDGNKVNSHKLRETSIKGKMENIQKEEDIKKVLDFSGLKTMNMLMKYLREKEEKK